MEDVALVFVILVALGFDYVNGFHDAANSIATVVSTRVLSPRLAVMWAAAFNFIAFLFFGLHVAQTVGVGIVAADIVDARVIFGALMGAIVAATGLMQTAYGGASTTTVGDLMELDAVAACVIGGTSLKGGRGSVPGVLFGALIMACLINGMTLLAVKPEAKFIARGLVLVLAVWMDVRMARTAK